MELNNNFDLDKNLRFPGELVGVVLVLMFFFFLRLRKPELRALTNPHALVSEREPIRSRMAPPESAHIYMPVARLVRYISARASNVTIQLPPNFGGWLLWQIGPVVFQNGNYKLAFSISVVYRFSPPVTHLSLKSQPFGYTAQILVEMDKVRNNPKQGCK